MADMQSPSAPERRGALKRVIFFLKLLEIRLRFVAILVVTAIVVGYWDHIQNYYERWQRGRAARVNGNGADFSASRPAESEFEFYCPMHSFVIRDHEDKCPICGMNLSKRAKGAPAELPPGAVARVQVSPERVMQAGVQVEPVAYRLLMRTVRSYGLVEPDETRMARIIARFPGRIDDLMVNATGAVVKKGEPLARIYSPKFLAASQEYLQSIAAQRGAAGGAASADEKRVSGQIAEYARQRLLLAGYTAEQLEVIAKSGKANDTVVLHAPLAGTVLEKSVLLGDSVEEGQSLYSIADLGKVWIQALVAEPDLDAVKLGMAVEVSTVSRPGEIFYGTADFIYPTVDVQSRSGKVRVVVDNPQGKLKPGMYVTAVMRAPVGQYGEVAGGSEPASAAAAPGALAAPIKLPTANQADADRFLAALKPGASYYVCSMDPDVVGDRPGDCPKCGMHLAMAQKAANQRTTAPPKTPLSLAGEQDLKDKPSAEQWAEGFTCPMHPDELSDSPGVCQLCNCGMKLTKWRVERVPSVPESAVIDTGERQIVYVEAMPGVFDAHEVQLGPRAGAYYPIVVGLALGDRIVSRGSFLIDAEARLNPAASGLKAVRATPASETLSTKEH